MLSSRCSLFLVIAVFTAKSGITATSERQIWTALTRHEFTEARSLADTGSSDASSCYAGAIALLASPYRTKSDHDKASELLRTLDAKLHPSAVAAAAAYFEARRVQIHGSEPDPTRAAYLYRSVFLAHPATYHGQLALLRSIPLRLYFAETEAKRRKFLAELVDQLPRLTYPEIRRNAHLALADVVDRLRLDPAVALRHYQLAAAEPFASPLAAADALVRLATQARELGQREESIAACRRFVALFPNDRRTHDLRMMAIELANQQAP